VLLVTGIGVGVMLFRKPSRRGSEQTNAPPTDHGGLDCAGQGPFSGWSDGGGGADGGGGD
jgi:hypothetical protein